MNRRSPSPRNSFHNGSTAHAFTLVELMLSVSLLIMLVVMVTQLTNSATKVTTTSRKHIAADAQARMVFDRMANDFGGMVLRRDVDVICKGLVTLAGNDALYFFSQAPAYFDNQTLTSTSKTSMALVGYRINNIPGSPFYGQLERLGKGLTWDGTPTSSGITNGMAFLPSSYAGTPDLSGAAGYLSSYSGTDGMPSIGTPGNFADSTDGDYHVIGDGVFRLAYCYLLKPYFDATGAPQPARFSNLPYNGTTGHNSVYGWQDVAAIVVTLAILDNESQKMITPTTLASMKSMLPDTGAAPALPTWQTAVISSIQAPPSGVPKAVVSQVRIYQRCFYLNNK